MSAEEVKAQVDNLTALFYFPHPVLKCKCAPLGLNNADELTFLEQIVPKMRNILMAFKAYGLAAPQLGAIRRMFVMQLDNGLIEVVLNPAIDTFSKTRTAWVESCLSFPGRKFRTSRSSEITVTYTTWPLLVEKSAVLTGMEALIFQHELDHLNGKTVQYRDKGMKRIRT